MNSIYLKAPATSANVGPGYDIFALALEEPYDEFELSLNNSDKISLEIIGNTQNIPIDISENTGSLAISELFKRKNIVQGVHIKIIKTMPSGGGLGTTGASASACIYGINKLLDLGLNNNELIDFARLGEVASGGSPHADNVAAAMLGGFVLIKSYNPVDVLKLEIPRFTAVLAVIKKSQRTTRGFITYEIGQEKLKEQMARCSRVIHAIHTKDIVEFGNAINVDHIAEPVRGAAIPSYWEIKQQVLNAGAYGFTISGGGSSVIAICNDNNAQKIEQIMKIGFSDNPHFVQTIVTHSSNSGILEI
ncbi:MAG: homoserine kinase [Bacteroidetes bacterium GWA2_31_9]|nr:MAG: homoserine kinase [Bacteroidetes bacterium GWA2_31_9]